MSIYTVKVPLDVSKRIFELFLFRSEGEKCLTDLLESMLMTMRPKMLKMTENELNRYLIDCSFV
jgi:hypothetical protein